MTTISFIRHGVTNWNLERRAQGQTDIPLNDEGLLQVKAVGCRFKSQSWDAIYSSDLNRAKATANAIGNVLSISVRTDTRLRELYFGQIEGTNEKERTDRWGSNWKNIDLGIETNSAVQERVDSFIRELIIAHPKQRVIVVSHGAVMNQLFQYLLKDRFKSCRLENTSVTELRYDNGNWNLNLLNCSSHLSTIEEMRTTRN